jgi:hypothetical protein
VGLAQLNEGVAVDRVGLGHRDPTGRQCSDGGGAQAAFEHGPLTEQRAGPELGHRGAVDVDAHHTVDHEEELVARLARLDFDAEGGEPLTAIGSIEVLASAEVDSAAASERVAERRSELEAEVKRAEGKLANEGFVAKAPPAVVEAEREKLERYRAELAELG